MNSKISGLMTTFALLLLFPGFAWAHSVCGTLTYYENREDNSNTTGSKFTSSTIGDDQPLKTATVYVYDMDGSCIDVDLDCSESDDDYLGSATTNSSGYFCVSGVGTGEDVYLQFKYEAQVGKVKMGNGSTPIVYSPQVHMDITGNVTRNLSATCFLNTSGECSLYDEDDFPVQRDLAYMLASMVDVDTWTSTSDLQPNGFTAPMVGYYNGRPGFAQCTTGLGTSWNADDFCVTATAASQNHVVVHEMGHLVHRRYLNLDEVSLSSPIGSPDPGCPGDWTGESDGKEKCAAAEGWADFFATTIYFHPSATQPYHRNTSWNLEGDTTAGNNFMGPFSNACASVLIEPEDQEANVARFFWDLYDSTTTDDDGYDNDSRQTLSTLMKVWDDFPAGTCEHRAEESTNDGRNILDYVYWATNGTYSFGSNTSSELAHNCLDDSYDGGPLCN